MKKLCVRVLLYIAALLGCLAGTWVISQLAPFPNWAPTGLALWFLFCIGALCVPDEAWDWLLKK